MKLKVKEVKRKKGFFTLVQSGLGIAVIGSEDDIPADMVAPLCKIILDWKKKRDTKAHVVSLTFSADVDMHPAIEAAFFQLYKREPMLQHTIDRLSSISVTLCDENGRPIRSYAIDQIGLLHGKYKRIETPLETFERSVEKPKKKRRAKREETEDEEADEVAS